MRIRDWSSDCCSSDLGQGEARGEIGADPDAAGWRRAAPCAADEPHRAVERIGGVDRLQFGEQRVAAGRIRHCAHPYRRRGIAGAAEGGEFGGRRSEEHTSELQSLMRISYAVFCLKKKTNKN